MEDSKERIVLKGITLAEKWLDGNKKISPKELIEWLANVGDSGWSNLYISVKTEPFEAYVSGEQNYKEKLYNSPSGQTRIAEIEERKKLLKNNTE